MVENRPVPEIRVGFWKLGDAGNQKGAIIKIADILSTPTLKMKYKMCCDV